MTDQVEEAHRQYETEKCARIEVEKSLRNRIAELEERLSNVRRDAEMLTSERYSASDSEPENKRIAVEQEQTIAILKANVEKLENLVVGMRDGFDEKEQRRDQRGRQETRYCQLKHDMPTLLDFFRLIWYGLSYQFEGNYLLRSCGSITSRCEILIVAGPACHGL